MVSLLEDGEQVLDVGCANGYSTVQLASRACHQYSWPRPSPRTDRSGAQALSSSSHPLSEIGSPPWEISIGRGRGDLRQGGRDPSRDQFQEWANQRSASSETRPASSGGRLHVGADFAGLEQAESSEGWVGRYRNAGIQHLPQDQQLVINTMRGGGRNVRLSNFASTTLSYASSSHYRRRRLGGRIDRADPNAEWNTRCSTFPVWR